MVVRLRLARHGTKGNPFYHIVAINDAKPRDARPIEKLGEYDPIPRPVQSYVISSTASSSSSAASSNNGAATARRSDGLFTSGIKPEKELTRMEKRIEWNPARIRHWLDKGAQPSKPVARLLDRAGLIPEGKHYKGIHRPPPGSPLREASAPGSGASSSAGSGPGIASRILSAAGVSPSAKKSGAAATPVQGGKAGKTNPKREAAKVGKPEGTMDQAQ